MAESGYSKTPLYKKLGIKSGATALIHNSPKDYKSFFNELPNSVNFVREASSLSVDFIHTFCITYHDLQEVIKKHKASLKKDGMIWISWPKGGSSIGSEINRDVIREYFLANGLVDVKVASIDEDWSGLKFVYRLKDR